MQFQMVLLWQLWLFAVCISRPSCSPRSVGHQEAPELQYGKQPKTHMVPGLLGAPQDRVQDSPKARDCREVERVRAGRDQAGNGLDQVLS